MYNFIKGFSFSGTSWKSALEFSQERGITRHTMKLGDIKVKEDMTLIFGEHGRELPMTANSFEALAKLVDVPRPFAYAIPEALLQENMNTLLQSYKDTSVTLIESALAKGIIGATVKTKMFDLTDFITGMAAVTSNDKPLEVQEIYISDTGCILNLLTDFKINTHPNLDDITQVGLMIKNSDTGLMPTIATLLLFRLICSNGAQLPSVMGKVTCTLKEKDEVADKLIAFSTAVGRLVVDGDKVGTALKKMPDAMITDEVFKKYWSSVNSIIKDSHKTDKLFRMVEEERKELIQAVVTRKRKQQKLVVGEKVTAPQSLDVSWWDMMVEITALEKNYKNEPKRREKLYKLGGYIPYHFMRGQ